VHSAVVHNKVTVHIDERPIIGLSVEEPSTSLRRLEESHRAVAVIVTLVSNRDVVNMGNVQGLRSVNLLENVRLGNGVEISVKLG
jgi:hypothetical protein